MKIKNMALIAVLASLLVIQKEVLSFIPNVSFTMLLMVVYSVALGKNKASLIIIIYVIIDSIIYGSFNTIYTPLMLIGWLFTPLIINKNNYLWANVLCSFVYMWIFVLPSCIMYDIPFKVYMASDISFEIIFVLTNFATVLSLGKPLIKALNTLKNK